MENELVELFLVAKEFSEKSKKYYTEIKYSGANNKIEISIRIKFEHIYVETREIYLSETGTSKIYELIEFIKNYEEEQ